MERKRERRCTREPVIERDGVILDVAAPLIGCVLDIKFVNLHFPDWQRVHFAGHHQIFEDILLLAH